MSTEAGSTKRGNLLLVKLRLLFTRDDELFPVRGAPKRVLVEVLRCKTISRRQRVRSPRPDTSPAANRFAPTLQALLQNPEQPRGRLSPGSTVSPPHARTHYQRIPTPPPPPGESRGHQKVHWEALQAATSARPINRWPGWLFKRPTANRQNFFQIRTGAGGLWGTMRVVKAHLNV